MFHFHRFDNVPKNYNQFETNLNNFNNQISNTLILKKKKIMKIILIINLKQIQFLKK